MSIHQVGPSAGAAAAQAVESGSKESFGEAMKQAGAQGSEVAARSEVSPTPVLPSRPGALAQHTCSPEASSGVAKVESAHRVDSAQAASAQSAARMIDQVTHAQAQMDRVLAQARSGKSFTPAELLGLQAQVYQASQELDLAGKVVEKATSGVKQVLQTQM